jgi:hypothetical protein
MVEILGTFIHDLPCNTEFLLLGFSPGSLPIKQRWRNNGLSADFLADYTTTFFPGESFNKIADIKSTVSYIANELLENAMKYSDDQSKHPISLGLHLFDDKFVFVAGNPIPTDAIDSFKKYITTLLDNDPYDLYVQKLESNSEQDETNQSGLGYLTMINDYNAVLGWKFEPLPEPHKSSLVSTMVQVSF